VPVTGESPPGVNSPSYNAGVNRSSPGENNGAADNNARSSSGSNFNRRERLNAGPVRSTAELRSNLEKQKLDAVRNLLVLFDHMARVSGALLTHTLEQAAK